MKLPVCIFLFFILTITIHFENVFADEKEDLNRCLDRMDYCETRCISGIVCQYEKCIKGYGCEETYVNELKEKLGMNEKEEKGGCLIATATYGSELAPQVQQLRELRDNTILKTNSGLAFMSTFNQFYYSFSPTIADYEREQPIFKEIVKITLQPMLASLSILNYVGIDSEHEMLVYGIGIIGMNVGMYFVIPISVVWKIKKSIKK